MKAVAASAATKRRWSGSSDAPTKKALKKAGVKAVADTVSVDSYGQGVGYGERGEYDRGGYEYDDAYGERRGVRGTGPYSRYRRR